MAEAAVATELGSTGTTVPMIVVTMSRIDGCAGPGATSAAVPDLTDCARAAPAAQTMAATATAAANFIMTSYLGTAASATRVLPTSMPKLSNTSSVGTTAGRSLSGGGWPSRSEEQPSELQSH